MSLSARVTVTARNVDVALDAASGATTALLGPNGSGKSTVLESLAGLLRPDAGAAEHEGVTLWGEGRWLEPRDRRVALVTQQDALFPWMSVLDNVAFGPKARGADDPRGVAMEWLERVGAADLAARKPGTLSGGQARRVSIARALASSPQLILLDEPLAGLDLESSTAIRALLSEVLADVTALIATHAALDAHVLADHVVVLDSGSVAETGPVTRVLTKPHTAFAARMAGRVLLTGASEAEGIRLNTGELVPCEMEAVVPGVTAGLAIHPRDVALEPDGIKDVVTALEPHGDLVRVHGKRLAADVDPLAQPLPAMGEIVRFSVNSQKARAYSV